MNPPMNSLPAIRFNNAIFGAVWASAAAGRRILNPSAKPDKSQISAGVRQLGPRRDTVTVTRDMAVELHR
jgi:hypothetical protein